jgi:hypothetical protein
MNGRPLTREHGYPIRVIVPGFIGARSVKFLQKIIVQPQESTSFFQRKDYKVLPPWVGRKKRAWEKNNTGVDVNYVLGVIFFFKKKMSRFICLGQLDECGGNVGFGGILGRDEHPVCDLHTSGQ